MPDKNKVRVTIHGRMLTVMGAESEEYMKRVAEYIDDKLRELRKSSPQMISDTDLSYILTSVNVADDYFKEIEKNIMLEEEVQRLRMETKMCGSTKEMEELQAEFKQLKLELETMNRQKEQLHKQKNEWKEEKKNLLSEMEKYKAIANETVVPSFGLESTISKDPHTKARKSKKR